MIKSDFIRQLYEDEAVRLYYFIKKLIGDGELAQDIVQETFCVATRRAEELINHPQPVAWLYQTAKYIILSECRKKQKRDMNCCYEDMEEIIRDDSAELALISAEEDMVKTVLSDSEYRIVELVHIQGYKTKEAADELDMKEGTLRVRLLRIRNKLKSYNGGNG